MTGVQTCALPIFGAVGTPAYRAPELWEGTPPADETTDIYSLGCVFAEMLSGQVLFDGETNNVIINKHLNHAPRIPEGLPKEIVSVIKKALAKTQRDRYESTMTFSAAIAIAQAKLAKAQGNGEQFQRSLLAARDSLKEVEETTAIQEVEGGQDRKRIEALRAEANGLQKELERLKAPHDHPDQPPRKGIIYAAAAAALLLVGFLVIRFVPFTPSAPQPDDTPTPLPVAAVQKTATPKVSSTATKAPTMTSIPIHPVLVFEEDFSVDKLGWKGENGVVRVNKDGAELLMADSDDLGEWWGTIAMPRKTITIDGNCTIEVVISNKVRFSGLRFLSKDNTPYHFIIGSGERKNWPPGYASLGLLQPSLGDEAWDSLGDIEDLIDQLNDPITLKVVFIGSQVRVYVNGEFVAGRQDFKFSDTKVFGGFYVGTGDQFTLRSLRIWGSSDEIIQIQ